MSRSCSSNKRRPPALPAPRRPGRRPGLLGALLLLALLTQGRDASAQRARVDAFSVHYQRAYDAYEAQQYEEAAKELEAAYEARAYPRLLFNLAQVYLKLSRLQEAIDHYELFLGSADRELDARFRKQVQEHVARIRAAQRSGVTQVAVSVGPPAAVEQPTPAAPSGKESSSRADSAKAKGAGKPRGAPVKEAPAIKEEASRPKEPQNSNGLRNPFAR